MNRALTISRALTVRTSCPTAFITRSCKTAWKHPIPRWRANTEGAGGVTTETKTIVVRSEGVGPGMPASEGPATLLPGQNVFFQKRIGGGEVGEVKTEDLGSQVIEGVQATGVRSTETIAAGKIGNDRPISIVTEVWTSPELHTTVLSKRSDPRTGEQTFKLTNIQRGEPDPSLFTVPSDFKLSDNGPETFVYREKH